MELNPDLHYLVHRERGADAMRSAEEWRQVKSLKKHGESPGLLRRLALRVRGQIAVPFEEAVRGQERGPRQTATSSTL
jgi:hypothetical protein